MSEEQSHGKTATVIKKYANRRLYNTATSTYVTLDDLALMVKSGSDFLVYDAKTGEDITRSVLTQIIFEEENKGAQNLLPVNFLRQLIRYYGDSMQGLVPGYLEFSLDNLTKDPKKLTRLSHLELMREAGAEGVEMVMWLIMRGALDDKVDEVYRFYTVPASNTAVGHIILENRKKAAKKPAGKGKKPAPKLNRAAALQKVHRIRS